VNSGNQFPVQFSRALSLFGASQSSTVSLRDASLLRIHGPSGNFSTSRADEEVAAHTAVMP